MLLSQLASTSQHVAETSARRGKISELATCLAQLEDAETEVGVAFLAGEARQGRIGVGHAVLHAIAAAPAGEPTLTLHEVDAALQRIVTARGAGANGARTQALHALFSRATAPEQEFLDKLLRGELRQGALESVMLDAVAQAFDVPNASVRRAMMLHADLGSIARLAREGGDRALGELRLQLFRPLSPMLAQTAADPDEAITSLGEAAFEQKLDGARVQAHREGDEVRIFTRQLNDVTAALPELVSAVRALPARSLVLDGEAIALRPDGRPLPFQTTMRRFGRKLDVEDLRRELPLSSLFFDLLHLDGRDLLDAPASERARVLAELLPAQHRVERIVTADPSVANAFFERAIVSGHEGLVAKSLIAPYEAGRRGGGWLKIKRAHTLDLVVLAAEWGSGRRKGTLSNLHLGARASYSAVAPELVVNSAVAPELPSGSLSPATGFVMLGKTFKGMTDEMLAFQTKHLLGLETDRDASTVYVRPELVVEVAFDGVQRSSQYPGGVALRFARIKGYRLDKRPDEADSLETIHALAEAGGTLEPGSQRSRSDAG